MHLEQKIVRLTYGIGVCCVIIIVRLVYLQIITAHTLVMRGHHNSTRVEIISPLRGTIFDRNGTPLATHKPIYSVYWRPTGNTTLTSEQRLAITLLQSIINSTCIRDDEALHTRIARAEKRHHTVLITKDISYPELCTLVELFSNNHNIEIKTEYKRYYPHGMLASHLIGYVHHADKNGTTGLEKMYDSSLCGKPGTMLVYKDARGTTRSHQLLQDMVAGHHLHTTLDIELQKIAEHAFSHHLVGALIVMDPTDGSLLSMVSRPTFDPSLFLTSISHSDWQALHTHHALLNRAVQAYPPGSIFKLVTISAALETGIITPTTMVDCHGFSTFAHRKYWCSLHSGHKTLTAKQAIARSCNILCFEIGQKIDIDMLSYYAHLFGLGQNTGVLWHEKKGLVPSRQWKQTHHQEQWWAGETLSVAIGQSFLLATPLQIARLVGSIFTSYLVQPRMLLNDPVVTTPLNIHKSTLDFLKESMKAVVQYGTARSIKDLEDIDIYAKTSTAQINDLEQKKQGTYHLAHGWFAAYFKHKDERPLVIVILVEHAGSGRVATTIAKNFFIEYQNMVDHRNR